MATPEQVLTLRRMTGEPADASTYTDATLTSIIDAQGEDLNRAAAVVWQEKAASFAEMVDIQEADSSRKNSDLYKNAMDQLALYTAAAEVAPTPIAVPTYSTTRRIVR